MPINAKPEFFQSEKQYHLATTPKEKIAALEEMLKTAPSHKGAENLRAQIKQRLAKLRESLDKNRQASKGRGKHLAVKKEGAAQVILASLTNAGKSSLITTLTNAKPTVADYEYTTMKPEMGIMDHEGIQIQLIEVPAITKDYAYRGDGPAYFSIMRGADLIIFLIDNTKDKEEQLEILHDEFEKAQIKLNAEKPKITIKKQGVGGIEFLGKRHFQFTIREATKMLQTHAYHNAVVSANEPVTLEDLADVINESLVYLPLLVVYTKADLAGEGVSVKTKQGLPELKKNIFDALSLIKVFTKSPGKSKDLPPVALYQGENVKKLAQVIHKDFYLKFRYARVWGDSMKHDGQKVGLEHELKDNDIVEFHLK